MRSTARFALAAAAGSLALFSFAGCSATTGPRSVANPDVSVKAPMIELAVQKHDTSVIPQLVHDLDDADPANRFYAIDGLRKLTGESFGYRFYDDEDARKPAVGKWQSWLLAHENVVADGKRGG